MSPTARRRIHLPLLAAIASIGLFAAACSKSDEGQGTTAQSAFNVQQKDAGPPVSGGSVVYGVNAETNNWSPYFGQWSGSSYTIANAVYDPLGAYDVNGDVQPYLAQAFEHNADFTQWTIKLRKGVTFQDGTAVNAGAVKKNLEAHRASVLTQETMAFVSGIETPDGADGLTVQVNMNKP